MILDDKTIKATITKEQIALAETQCNEYNAALDELARILYHYEQFGTMIILRPAMAKDSKVIILEKILEAA